MEDIQGNAAPTSPSTFVCEGVSVNNMSGGGGEAFRCCWGQFRTGEETVGRGFRLMGVKGNGSPTGVEGTSFSGGSIRGIPADASRSGFF